MPRKEHAFEAQALAHGASPETQATAVHRRLRADILSGRLAPGWKLKVHELAAQYGAGPAPLREALAQLAAEGLAVRLEQRGFRVRALDEHAFSGLIRTRCLVETLALRESVLRGDARWHEAVAAAEQRLARIEMSLDSCRFVVNPAWERAHQAFHHALIAACGAPQLLDFCERLREEADRYRALSNAVAYPQRDVVAEHATLARAALQRDADRAAALLGAHLSTTASFVALALQQRLAQPTPARARRSVSQLALPHAG